MERRAVPRHAQDCPGDGCRDGPNDGDQALEYCRIESPFLTQWKLNSAYTIR